jgi:uronate dehydrogenase
MRDGGYDRVLITGAAGAIGDLLRRGLRGRYPVIRLTDVADMASAEAGEEVVKADLADYAAVESAMRGCDAVVHLGGISVEDAWPAIARSNINGTYNVYEAARQCGVKRIVFASSNHAAGFWRRSTTIGPDVPTRPDTYYGLSKVFGEGLARLYADKHGLSSVCLRIGQFRVKPTNVRMLSLWLSHRDMVSLARCSLEAKDIHFEVVYGISANTRAWYRNPGAGRIGYRGEDDAEDFASEVLGNPELEAEDDIGAMFQGGPFCSDGFGGDPELID